MKNDLAYAHGSDWDEVEVPDVAEWVGRDRDEEDDYDAYEEDDELDYDEDDM